MPITFPTDRTGLTPPGTGPLETGDRFTAGGSDWAYDASIPSWNRVVSVPATPVEAPLTLTLDALGVTTAAALTLENTTPATGGVQQSPAVVWTGTAMGYGKTGSWASEDVKMGACVTPQGGYWTGAVWYLKWLDSGGTWQGVMSVTSGGALDVQTLNINSGWGCWWGGSYGGIGLGSGHLIKWSSSGANGGFDGDTFLGRGSAAADLRQGGFDSAAPVSQTFSVPSVGGAVEDTPGVDRFITGSQGTGTGAGGDIVFKVAPAGSTGTSQNALVETVRFGDDRNTTLTKNALGTTASPALTLKNATLATNSVQQNSPAFELLGQGWLPATSESKAVGYRAYITPIHATELWGTPQRGAELNIQQYEPDSATWSRMFQLTGIPGNPYSHKFSVGDPNFGGVAHLSQHELYLPSMATLGGNGGGLAMAGHTTIRWHYDLTTNTGPVLYLGKRDDNNLRQGNTDSWAAQPASQYFSVQNVYHTSGADIAGADRYFDGSQGTGTGTGGAHVFRVAPAGATGSANNALVESVRFGPDGSTTLTRNALGTTPAPALRLINTTAATDGADQISPSFEWQSNFWNVDGTGGSQAVKYRMQSDTADYYSRFYSTKFQMSVNGGAWTTLLDIGKQWSGRYGFGLGDFRNYWDGQELCAGSVRLTGAGNGPTGGLQLFNANGIGWMQGGFGWGEYMDLVLLRRDSNNLCQGFISTWGTVPASQTLSVSNAHSGPGNSDINGADRYFDGSCGVGTGVGGAHVFRVAPAGTTGTAQNALAVALRIEQDKSLTISEVVAEPSSPAMAGDLAVFVEDDKVKTKTSAGAVRELAYARLTIINDATEARTLAAGDLYAKIRATNTTGFELSIPEDVAEVGDYVTVRRTTAAGPVTLDPAAGVVVNGSLVVDLEPDQEFALVCVGDNEWDYV